MSVQTIRVGGILRWGLLLVALIAFADTWTYTTVDPFLARELVAQGQGSTAIGLAYGSFGIATTLALVLVRFSLTGRGFGYVLAQDLISSKAVCNGIFPLQQEAAELLRLFTIRHGGYYA